MDRRGVRRARIPLLRCAVCETSVKRSGDYAFGTCPFGVIVSTACGRICDSFCVRSCTERPVFADSPNLMYR